MLGTLASIKNAQIWAFLIPLWFTASEFQCYWNESSGDGAS